MLKMQRLSTRFLKATACGGHLCITEKLTRRGHGSSHCSHSLATLSRKSSATTQKFVPEGKLGIFASYTVYKGKAALASRPILPTFCKFDFGGGGGGGLKVDRRGCMMLTFWPAIGERKYDWEKKQIFALSTTEIGSFINMGPQDACEFFHDPSMLTSNAGQVRKSLSIKPHADGSGYFFSLNVVNNVTKSNDRFVVPITAAEFAVMRTAFSFVLPHIMGWDQYINPGSISMLDNKAYKVEPQALDSEWDK